ncbi:MAG: hypothetical protein K9N07_10090 [Candidatus Cloacimonetes bacterium]|nr:hypothetical protein [Candidatus Cloacimonadota bacterium]
MRPSIFFIFVLFLATAVSAFDCSYFDNQEDCIELNSYNESLISDLIYTDTSFPNHDFIKNYNDNIDVDSPPYDTTPVSDGNVRDVWFTFLSVLPSVSYQDQLLVPNTFTLRSEYDYTYNVPSEYYNSRKRDGDTCRIRYSLNSQSDNLQIYANGNYLSSSKNAIFSISRPAEFKGVYTASITIREQYYEWDRYCCSRRDGRCVRYCYDCEYDYSSYDTDSVTVEDTISLVPYNAPEEPSFTFLYEYNGNYQGVKSNTNNNLEIDFANSNYKESFFEYSSEFSKLPYYFLTLKAENSSSKKIRNLYLDNYSITVKEKEGCIVKYSNFFDTEEKECDEDFRELEIKEFKKIQPSKSWNLLFKIVIFIFINILLYLVIKKYWGRIFVPVALILLTIPAVHAEECGLTNLASCIPEKMYEFFIELLNAPLQPLLELTRSLMENPPSIELFQGVWAIMVYVVSLFYGFLFMYSGFQFLFSGHNVVRRAMAKEWLKNTVIMITLIQGSFYLYGLVLEIGAILTSSVLSMVNEHFFLITADNIVNIGLEFLFLSFYVLTLFITILCLLVRYIIVASGVIFAPIGIFCYFIPPLRSYGKLILNLLGTFIFITFIDAIIILACSMLIEIPLFENIKILIMISCFSIINVIFMIMIIKAIFKAVFSGGGSGQDIAQAVKYIAMIA